MNRKNTLTGILILQLITGILAAQTPYMRHQSLFRGKEEYNVNVIYQDSRGWIWFGTDRGLFRFDGINHTWFTTADSLASNNITSIHLTKRDILWTGHMNGEITRYDGRIFRKFRPESGLGNIQITDIESDSSGVVWYSTRGEGLFRWDGKYLSNLNTDDGISDNYIYDIETDSAGVMWLATDNGITRLSDGKAETISQKDGLADNIVRVIKTAPDGRLWIGTEEKGITVFNPADRTFVNMEGWDFGPVTGLTVSMENEIWISTDRDIIVQLRLLRNFASRYRNISITQGSSTGRISTLIKDREENIWIGGHRFVTQILPPVFEFLNPSNGSPFEMCYGLAHDKNDNLWVCSEKGLYRGIPGNTGYYSWTNISEKLNLVGINFISVYSDQSGSLWAGTYGGGVFRINPDNLSFRRYTEINGLSDNNVISISGSNNLIWFSTLGGGISCFNTATSDMRSYHDPELAESYVYATRTDSSGRTWIAGSIRSPSYIENDKLFRLTPGKQRIPQLYSVALDTSGGVWFSTGDRGIIRIAGDTIITLGKEDGITFEKIESIAFDKMNNLIVISNTGFIFYNPGKGVMLDFGENSGLSYQYPILNSVYTDREGQIWIGTETGIIKYNPEYLHFIGKKPHIFLSTRNSFYDPITRGREKFSYRDNNFTFGFTGIWFSNPEGLKYRYMLIGNDLNWTYSNRNQTREYSNLPAGRYKFVAEVSLDEKNWYSSRDSTYSFRILPPFWQRWWFIAGAALMLLLAVYTYIRLRLRKLVKDKARLEEEVRRRTEEIRQKNEVLEEQKTEIEKQRDLAEEQRDQIEAQKEEIQSSIRYAHHIQSAALPPKKLLDSVLPEYFILYKPCQIVSGDFYWVARNNTHIFFAVGDCTGHGVPGSFMSMLGLSALNDIVKSLKTCKASIILDLLRTRIRDSLHQGADREMVARDGMDISLCILESDSHNLQYAGAHNPIYIVRNNSIMVIPADKIEIGSSSLDNMEFTNHNLQCREGDLIYLFTDGYADQFGGPNRKKFKYQRFKDTILSIHKESMERQKQILDNEIESWKGDFAQTDDILVMGIKLGLQKEPVE